MSKTSTHKILMAKRVAARYLEQVAREGRTLTVYFPSEGTKTAYLRTLRTSSYGAKLSCNEGFDYVTVVSLDREAVAKAEEVATHRGFEWTDI